MHPFFKGMIAGIVELAVIATLFYSVDSGGSINHESKFTALDAIFWTFISILALGFVIYYLKRSTERRS
ncbi:MAG: hypothetical protein QOD99_2502 [Chthoniobacter sp.]|jgi:dolichyl-phosphate-mannose--protein O-mannosyl transferase|nr:hypothetical protein [Chthoniobacter sp.]